VFLINVPVALLGLVPLCAGARVKERGATTVDVPGALLCTGAWPPPLSIIDMPTAGWHAGPVLLAGGVALVLLIAFVLWERHTPTPMLLLEPFGDRRFSVRCRPLPCGVRLMGSLFVLTQYLQFSLASRRSVPGCASFPSP